MLIIGEEPASPEATLDECEVDAQNYLREYAKTDLRILIPTARIDTESQGFHIPLLHHLYKIREKLIEIRETLIVKEDDREAAKRHIRLERARDGCEMLICIQMIRDGVTAGLVDRSSLPAGFRLGRLYEKFKVRESELEAWRGGKVLRAAQTGGLGRRKPLCDDQELVNDFHKSRLSGPDFAKTRCLQRFKTEPLYRRKSEPPWVGSFLSPFLRF